MFELWSINIKGYRLGINIAYSFLNSGHINNVTCGTKFEKYCTFDNLK